MSWYLDTLKKYADFSGRACRTEYWMFVLFNIIIIVVLSVVDEMLGTPGIFVILYQLGVLIPSIAVGVRRLHDTDKSGWWLLISVVPLIGPLVLLIFFVRPGTPETNSYGQEPT